MLQDDLLEIAVQVKGKLRGRVSIPAEADAEVAIAAARSEENVAKWLIGAEVIKEI